MIKNFPNAAANSLKLLRNIKRITIEENPHEETFFSEQKNTQ